MTLRLHSLPDRSHSRRRGLTLAELIVSCAATMVLLAGLSSAIFVASSAASPNLSAPQATEAALVLDEIAAELRLAKGILEKGSSAVTFSLDDRVTDPDPFDESVRYFWDGTPGGTLSRTYNGITTPWLTNVYNFSLQYSTRTAATNKRVMFLYGSGGAAAHDNTRVQIIEGLGYQVTRKDVTAAVTQSELELAVIGADAIYVSSSVLANDLGTKLLASSKGIVLENLSCAVPFSAATALPIEFSGDSIKLDHSDHHILSGVSTGQTVILSSSATLAKLDSQLAPDLVRLGTNSLGQKATLFAAIAAGGRLLDNSRAAGPRVLVPWGGTGTDPALLNATGRTLWKQSLDWAAGIEVLAAVDITLRVASSSGPVLSTRVELVGRPLP